MVVRVASWILLIVGCAALFPSTYIAWLTSTNTCTGSDPFGLIYGIASLPLLWGYWKHAFGLSRTGATLGLWAGSTLYHALPLLILILFNSDGGPWKAIERTWTGYVQIFSRDLQRNPIDLAFRTYLIIWMPIAAFLSLGVFSYFLLGELHPRLYVHQRPDRGILGASATRRLMLFWIIPISFFAAGCVTAHHEIWRDDLVTCEHRSASAVMRLLQMRELEHPGVRVTNISQLFATPERPYPREWHQQFRVFGKYAGFDTSFYEKYVFPSTAITGRYVQGEVVFINAKPYPDRDGRLQRMLVSKEGTGYESYRIRSMDEKSLQRVFHESGSSIPEPAEMAPPTAAELPRWFDVQVFFVRAAEIVGLGPQWALELATASVIMLVGLIVLLARRSQRLQPTLR